MAMLGLIPARGGSKAIPRKNLAPIAGQPLIAWTVQAAQAARSLARIVVSTDDPEIKVVSEELGAEVPFLRPASVAEDDTPMIDVVRHALDWFGERGEQYAGVVLLQPTSPLRQRHHIDEAVDLFADQHADSVVSVIHVPHRFSPYSVMSLSHGALVPFWQSPTDFDPSLRQQQPVLWARNGPAVLVTRAEVAAEGKDLYGQACIPYPMSERESVDIDEPFDLELAEWLLERRRPESVR